MFNFYFKSDFDRFFFSSDSLWNFIPAIVNKSLPSSYVFRDKRGQICVLFFHWISLKIYFLKGSQQICCSFDCFIDIRGPKVKSLNCSFKSYFNGLKINIGPYVKWIKICFSQNLELIEYEFYKWPCEQYRLSWASSFIKVA